MPNYDDSLFSPPAPVAMITLRNPESGASLADIPMLIDSGADVTLLPRSFVEQIGIIPRADASYELVAFDGSVSISQVVQADLIFLHKIFKGQYLLLDQGSGILGRDILNHVSLLLDGPQLQWEERRHSD